MTSYRQLLDDYSSGSNTTTTTTTLDDITNTSSLLVVEGDSMLEKMNYLNEVDESLRRFLVLEPRGQAQMSTDLLLPSTRPDADVGFIVLQGDKAHAMSGTARMKPSPVRTI